MKPVNLLPLSERRDRIAAAPANGSKIVVSVLAFVVLATGLFVLTKNQASSKSSQIARAQQDKAQAESQVQALKAYGDFRQIKQTRVQSVSTLANGRFDWERMLRELALLTPNKVWLTNITAGATADTAGSAAAGGVPAAGTAASSASPSVKISGCAPNQNAVAQTMVRLRSLSGASDVTLQSSTQPDDSSGSGGSSNAPSQGDNAAGGGTDCRDSYAFESTVAFTQATTTGGTSKRVPSRLGGGA